MLLWELVVVAWAVTYSPWTRVASQVCSQSDRGAAAARGQSCARPFCVKRVPRCAAPSGTLLVYHFGLRWMTVAAFTQWSWSRAKPWKPACEGRSANPKLAVEIAIQVTRALDGCGGPRFDPSRSKAAISCSRTSETGLEVIVIDFGWRKRSRMREDKMDLRRRIRRHTISASLSNSTVDPSMCAQTFIRLADARFVLTGRRRSPAATLRKFAAPKNRCLPIQH